MKIYYQDNKGSILTLDKMALISCSDIVVKKKYNVLEYDLDTEVLFTVETDDGMQPRGLNFAVVDHDYVETLGITMIKGSRDGKSGN